MRVCPEAPQTPRVAFATHAWEFDWRVVLSPDRFRMIVESHQHAFSDVVVILNNISQKARARRLAEYLVESRAATVVVDAEEYLTDSRLGEFGLDPVLFRASNPYFSTAQLTALHYLRGRAEYVLHMSGDVWLEEVCRWIPRAVEALEKEPAVRGLNLCRNIYRNLYPVWAHEETDTLWISKGRQRKAGKTPDVKGRGWGLSDLAYLIAVSPATGWSFELKDSEAAGLWENWPPYARPCFEMYFSAAMMREGWWYAALKPLPLLAPVTRHKNFPRSRAKLLFYEALGCYKKGGRFATR